MYLRQDMSLDRIAQDHLQALGRSGVIERTTVQIYLTVPEVMLFLSHSPCRGSSLNVFFHSKVAAAESN